MANIVITSSGTMGDHLPYIALGKALLEQGHRVQMAFGTPMHSYALKSGLETVGCGVAWGEDHAKKYAKGWDHWQQQFFSDQEYRESMGHFLKRELGESFKDLLTICADADLLICSVQRHIAGWLVEEKLGVPWVGTSVMPHAQIRNFDRMLCRRSDLFLSVINDIRTQFDLPSITLDEWHEVDRLQPKRALLGASQHFAPEISAYSSYQPTGFWFYQDPDWQDWQPDAALCQFLDTDPKPLFLSFSSLPLENARSVLELHVRAAAQLGRRLLVQRGWAGFDESLLPEDCDRDAVWFTDFINQDWLFPRIAAIIHHGGMGTIARALKNGCPMLVEPYGNDQFFNAKQVLSLKVGVAMHPHKLTVNGLVNVLKSKVLTDNYRQTAQQVALKFREENGLEVACGAIKQWLATPVAA